MIILDTNVVSELMRPAPNEAVTSWVKGYSLSSFALTSITIAEIQRGLSRLPLGKRRTLLTQKFEALLLRGFSGRVLSFDLRSANLYGKICLLREQEGLAIGAADMMIAASAKAAGASIATRNTKDFESVGLTLINPWEHHSH